MKARSTATWRRVSTRSPRCRTRTATATRWPSSSSWSSVPLATETSEFWKNHGEYNDVDASKIQTEVFRLPTTCFAEEEGSIVSSSRVLQWHWKAAEPPGEARTDIAIMSGLHLRMKELYAKQGGKFGDPILNLWWP